MFRDFTAKIAVVMQIHHPLMVIAYSSTDPKVKIIFKFEVNNFKDSINGNIAII